MLVHAPELVVRHNYGLLALTARHDYGPGVDSRRVLLLDLPENLVSGRRLEDLGAESLPRRVHQVRGRGIPGLLVVDRHFGALVEVVVVVVNFDDCRVG